MAEVPADGYGKYLREDEDLPPSTPGICRWLEDEGWTATARIRQAIRFHCGCTANHRILVDIAAPIDETRLESIKKVALDCRRYRGLM